MGLFDHLFKAKSPSDEEKVDDHASEPNAAAKPPDGAARPQPAQRPDPSAFLHPKDHIPHGAPGLTPAPRPGPATPKHSERKPGASGPTPGAEEIVLTLGDVLSRIPTHYLKPGAHDSKRELHFKINDLSSDIARGRAAVPLSRIAQLAPEIFVKAIGRDEDTEVRLPLQKLVEQIGLLRSRPKSPTAEKVARSITTMEWPSAGKPAASGEAHQPETIEVPATVEPLVAHSVVPPVIFAERVAAQKAVELKPAAEKTTRSVILGPPPVSETPAVTLAPTAPPPPPLSVSTPPPVILEVERPVEPARPEPPLAAAMATPEPVVPQPVSEPPKIVIEPMEEMAAKREVIPEPARLESVSMAPRLAPLESPQLDPGEESIHLGLAAILRTCPPEIVVGKLPQVDDSVRITLPFAPIDRQLVKGQVEVSALRFIASLPESYQRYFVAKVGVKVPIPLEEVFQNLPSPKHELTPSFTMPPPVVLAPADPAGAVVPAASVLEEKLAEPVILSARSEAPVVDVPAPPVAAVPEPLPEPVPPAPTASAEPPPIPTVAAALAESAPVVSEAPAVPAPVPAEEPAEPPPLPIVPEPAPEPEPEAAPAVAAEAPKLFFQPPIFRPHFMPPPPIIGFTPSEVAVPAAEPPSAPAPGEAAAASVTPPLESTIPETSEAVAPTAEAVASTALTVIVPVPESALSPAAAAPEPPKIEMASEEASESQPSAELMALAGEHEAPDLVQFSSEPVPFADLSETLAHETTYAPDLAEVVRIPEAETGEQQAPVAAEQVPAPDGEHRAVPIVEGLAAAAVAATIAEHAPLHFHVGPPVIEPPKIAEPAPTKELAPSIEEPQAAEEAPAPVEVPAAEKPVVEEPIAAETPAPPVEEPAPAQAAHEPEKPAAQEPPPSAPPTPAIPSIPLFPLPKVPAEHVPLEVLPPPALPLRRFDQDAVQALFMTEEALDLSKISHLAASLPGVYACVIATRDQACTGGTLPDGFDLAALLGLAPRVGEAAGRMPIGQLKHFTLYGDAYSVSFFERHGLSICAVHRPRSFVPGVREKLVALADELSR